jgi:phage gp29-like protein
MSRKSAALQGVKNYYFPVNGPTNDIIRRAPGDKDGNKNLNRYPAPVQFQRFRQDVKSWRDCMTEMEHAYYPYRVKQQRLFQDTVLNGDVFAAMERRKDLTLQRDFMICDEKGTPSEELKAIFKNKTSATLAKGNSTSWFEDFMTHTIDALFYSYSLISLGDVVNDAFPEITLVKRENVSPDRLNVSPYVYSLQGASFLDDPYRDWHVWVPTRSELGRTNCGYGLLYIVAFYELIHRNNLGFNADFNEIFNQPLRKGKTVKTEEAERAEFESALRDVGRMAYILLDDGMDDVEFVESKNVGSAYMSYESLGNRLKKVISKILLGHEDAMDSVPGKLGSNQDGDKSPVQQALSSKQSKDGVFVENVVNSQLLPLMRIQGFNIPINYHFEFLNDDEKSEIRDKEDKSNKATADIALTMKQAGMQMDATYFTERTGIPATMVIEQPNPINTDEPL